MEYHLCHTLNMILINIYIYRSHSLSRSLSRINNFKTTILQIYACVRLCITLQKLLDSCHSRLHNQSSINVTQLYVLHRKKATLFSTLLTCSIAFHFKTVTPLDLSVFVYVYVCLPLFLRVMFCSSAFLHSLPL